MDNPRRIVSTITVGAVLTVIGTGLGVATASPVATGAAVGDSVNTASIQTLGFVNDDAAAGIFWLDQLQAMLAGGRGVSDRRTPAGSLPRTYNIKTRDKVFFITIDDGNYHVKSALSYVRRWQLPVTVFLTNSAVNGDWNYFRSISSFGGSVENHTMTHRSLVKSGTNLSYEICRPQQIYTQRFDHQPTLIRPPYGYGGYDPTPAWAARAIGHTARSCGINRMIMWNATMDNGHFVDQHGRLTRGDIVIFHFKPSLTNDLKKVMAMARRTGLRPASLTDYVR